jgi:hypothetical protein
MRPQLHMTGLDLMLKCAEAWRRRYKCGEKRPPGVAQLVGKATHKPAEENLKHKMTTGALMPVEAVADMGRDVLNKEWDGPEGVWLPDGDDAKTVRGEAVDKVVRLSRLHATELAPVLNPTHVEREWALTLPGYPMDLAGTLDVQEGTVVRDLKTRKVSLPSNGSEVHGSQQLTAYALAVYAIDRVQLPIAVKLDALVDLKTPKTQTQESVRDVRDFQELHRRLEVAATAIDKEVFLPARPTDWWCSPRWCGYWDTCPYAARRLVGSGISMGE